MGIWTDVFLAGVELSRVDPEVLRDGPHGSLPTSSAKGIMPEHFAVLEDVLLVQPVGTAPVPPEVWHGDPNEGPWVYVLSERLQRACARLDSGDIAVIVRRWMASHREMRGASAEGCAEYLAGIAAIARQAQDDRHEHGNRLYLWVSV